MWWAKMISDQCCLLGCSCYIYHLLHSELWPSTWRDSPLMANPFVPGALRVLEGKLHLSFGNLPGWRQEIKSFPCQNKFKKKTLTPPSFVWVCVFAFSACCVCLVVNGVIFWTKQLEGLSILPYS